MPKPLDKTVYERKKAFKIKAVDCCFAFVISYVPAAAEARNGSPFVAR